MVSKINILFLIIFILIVFYLVISLGAGNQKKSSEPKKIKNYLFGVRILIVIIGLVSITLWFFFT